MALDQALLDRAERFGEAWLRLYTWEPHCLSFGRHEPARRRYDVERIQTLGLSVVRRPTGGRAVWHGRELTYAVTQPNPPPGPLRKAYLAVHEVLARALRTLGADATLAPTPARTPGVDAGACFAQPAGGEIMVGGRKVVGSAQLRQGSAFLQHGSILLEDDQAMVRAVSRGSAPPDLAAPLAALLGRTISLEEVTAAVAQAAADASPGDWERAPDPSPLLQEASRYFPHFQSPDWTWLR
jgi:lipoyl(octanoyl) transferase